MCGRCAPLFASPLALPLQTRGMLHVVAHLRRGDVWKPHESQARRVHHTDFFQAVLARIRALAPPILAPFALEYHAVTTVPQSMETKMATQLARDFPNATAHINDDANPTYHTFVTADVLVLDRSRFCHAAALLSENVIVSSPFRYSTSCSEDWVRAEDDGTFDEAAFVAALRRLRARRLAAEA